MKSHSPSIKELHEVYINVNKSFEEAIGSMNELQIELEEEISCLSAALDENRGELESCKKAIQQLTRRMPSELLTYQNAQGGILEST